MSQTHAMPNLNGAVVNADRFHTAILRTINAHLQCGTLTIVTPNGQRIQFRAPQPGPDGEITLHRWRTLRRMVFGGDVSFAEAFLDGDWSSPDVTSLIALAARNTAILDKVMQGSRAARLLNRVLHQFRGNSRRGSRRNIRAHYDLGNEFYACWLDVGMTYSSALYLRPDMTLEDAQTAKQDRVLELLALSPGQSVLEIGMGWGGLAERLARVGCRVTGLTLSSAQQAWSEQRLRGLDVEPVLRDYRNETGCYDRIVSIEMLEAVGEDYWPVYFGKLKSCLATGGTSVLQVITIADDRFEQYRRAADFIQRHIFPGGMLPSPTVLRQQVAAAGLRITACETFGQDYARTLAEWCRRFERSWPDIAAMGFPPRFRRLWHYYLCYCEAGFGAGALDVGLWRLEHAT